MTRINVGVHPSELPDKLLLAEHREITRIPNAILSGKAVLTGDFPTEFTLGKGHVRFFYLRIGYLHKRYHRLYDECRNRDFNVTYKGWSFVLAADACHECYRDWIETPEARQLIIERIESKGFSLLPKR